MLWSTNDLDAAIELAEAEAFEYAAQAGGAHVGLAQGYLLTDPLEHGSEVFSLMRSSSLTSDEYVDRYFDTGAERQRNG